MDDHHWLTERFQDHRPRLRAVAYRMLGSPGEADDALQEAWLRLSRSGASGVNNLGAWLATVVARVCLDMLHARKLRNEEPVGAHLPESIASTTSLGDRVDPEQQALLADSVGLALLVVLDALTPAERLAFVLHDLFAVPFEEIAEIVERSPAAARQLASRARRRVRGAASQQQLSQGAASQQQSSQAAASPRADHARQREIVSAFLAASHGGDLDALLALLAPDVVLRADGTAVDAGAFSEVRGAAAVADAFSGPTRAIRPALVNGAAGAVWAAGGRPRAVFAFTIARERIAEIDLVADPERLHGLEVVILSGEPASPDTAGP